VPYKVKLLEQAKDFLDTLSIRMRAKAFRTIELLQEFGPFLTAPHSKTLKGYAGLRELRVKQGSDICRLFYFHYDKNIYIITSGYVKKDRKTNKKEILKAFYLMKSLLEENHGENEIT